MEIRIVHFVIFSDNGIQFYDKNLYLIDKFQHPFGYHDHTVVFSNSGPLYNAFTKHAGQMPQGHAIGRVIYGSVLLCFFDSFSVHIIGEILADESHVWVGLQGNLQGQMTCHPPHDLANVPILDIRGAVCAQIADLVRKGPGSRMKAKGHGT